MPDSNRQNRLEAPVLNLVQRKQSERVASIAELLTKIVCEKCPESRERSLALTKIEEAMLWVNAAIARDVVTGPN